MFCLLSSLIGMLMFPASDPNSTGGSIRLLHSRVMIKFQLDSIQLEKLTFLRFSVRREPHSQAVNCKYVAYMSNPVKHRLLQRYSGRVFPCKMFLLDACWYVCIW